MKKIFVFHEVTSTNTVAKQFAQQGMVEGTIILAERQTHGRGRFDRRWESPPGGLYLSIILRPPLHPEKTTLLPLIAALTVSNTIHSLGLQSTIKWPNDVRINRKKVAGILLESEAKNGLLNYVIIGIGINVNIDLSQLPQDIRSTSISLSQEKGSPVDFEYFLNKLLASFSLYYTNFLNGAIDPILKEWKEQSDTLGKHVQINVSGELITGKAIDIDQSGFLILVTNENEQKTIISGDCLYLDQL